MKTVEIVKEKVDGVLSCVYDRLVVRGKWIKRLFSRGLDDPDCCLIGGVGFCVYKDAIKYTYDEKAIRKTEDAPAIHCLATAICELYPNRVGSTRYKFYMEHGQLEQAPPIITGFNDHRDTTIKDVARVIDKAREYEVIYFTG